MSYSAPLDHAALLRQPGIEPLGLVLGDRYRLVNVIGEGWSSRIYAAEDTQLAKRVAVKVLSPALAEDVQWVQRLHHEAGAASVLKHPHILTVSDWGKDEGLIYLVSDLITGGSVQDILDAGRRLDLSQALLVGIQAARGLRAAHQQGLVHRDIRPSNLMFGDDGELKITDLALSQVMGVAFNYQADHSWPGAARYAAPEQSEPARVTGRADIYSLAISLVEAVSGAVPLLGDNPIATLFLRTEHDISATGALDALGPLGEALEPAGRADPNARPHIDGFIAALSDAARVLPRPTQMPLVSLRDKTPGPAPSNNLSLSRPVLGAETLEREVAHRPISIPPPTSLRTADLVPGDLAPVDLAPVDLAFTELPADLPTSMGNDFSDPAHWLPPAPGSQPGSELTAPTPKSSAPSDSPFAPTADLPSSSTLSGTRGYENREVFAAETVDMMSAQAAKTVDPSQLTKTAEPIPFAPDPLGPAPQRFDWDALPADDMSFSAQEPHGLGVSPWSQPSSKYEAPPPSQDDPYSRLREDHQAQGDDQGRGRHQGYEGQQGFEGHQGFEGQQGFDVPNSPSPVSPDAGWSAPDPKPEIPDHYWGNSPTETGYIYRSQGSDNASEDEADQSAEPRWYMPTLVVAALAGLIAFTVGLLVLMAGQSESEDSAPVAGQLDNYVGQSLEDVRPILDEAEWGLVVQTTRRDGTVKGEILDQAPPPGTPQRPIGTMNLTVSDGPELRTVPVLTGRLVPEATQIIEDASLQVGVITERHDETIPAGQIIDVRVQGAEPAPTVESGTELDLVISAGPSIQLMPDLVGVPFEKVTAITDPLGLIVVSAEAFSPDQPVGAVIATEPAADTPVKRGTEVLIAVSTGPPAADPGSAEPPAPDSGE